MKNALSTFFDEISALKLAQAAQAQCSCSCAPDLGARLAAIELVMAGPADDCAATCVVPVAPSQTEACPPLVVAAAMVPVVAPAVASAITSACASALSSQKDQAEQAADAEAQQVAGHYSVETTPNGQPVLALHSTEEGSSEDIEAILLQAESMQVDRFLSLAQHQKATSEKVRRAAAARNRRAAAKKATL